MINLKTHANTALIYFFIAASLGILLRLFFVTPINANFRYLVHTHSHIALLGWVYLALTILIYKVFLSPKIRPKNFDRIVIFTHITLIGMLLSFPFTGYALFSIIFSSLFLIASYFFAGFSFKNVKEQFKNTQSFWLIKASLCYLVISSIGPWAIGGVMATLGNTSIWYKLSIYFYLHFQYNGWFILALLGLLFFIFEKFNLKVERKTFESFFINLNTGIILSFFLSALWVEPPLIVYLLAAVGAVYQVVAFFQLFLILKKTGKQLKKHLPAFVFKLLSISWILLIVKVLMQLVTAIPYFADLSANILDFVIGYLHWTFLGVVSISLFAFLEYFKLIKLPKWIFGIYFIGFILSEALIFYKGLSSWLFLPFFTEYFTILVSVSALIPLAIAFLLLKNFFGSKESV